MWYLNILCVDLLKQVTVFRMEELCHYRQIVSAKALYLYVVSSLELVEQVGKAK